MNRHNTYVLFKLPKPFIKHFKEDKFEDSLERIKTDLQTRLKNESYGCSGLYELEVIKMLKEELKASNIIEFENKQDDKAIS